MANEARLLLDSSVLLELLLDQARAGEVAQFFDATTALGLDFADAYQYVAAEKYDLVLVSFDADFDRPERGRKTPPMFSKGCKNRRGIVELNNVPRSFPDRHSDVAVGYRRSLGSGRTWPKDAGRCAPRVAEQERGTT